MYIHFIVNINRGQTQFFLISMKKSFEEFVHTASCIVFSEDCQKSIIYKF